MLQIQIHRQPGIWSEEVRTGSIQNQLFFSWKTQIHHLYLFLFKLPPSRARLAASVPQILVKTCWISAALEGGLAAGSKLAGGVPDGIPGVKVDVPGAKVDVPFVKVDVPVVKVDVPGVKVDVPGVEVDVPGCEVDVPVCEIDVMIKWMLSACSIICFSWIRP